MISTVIQILLRLPPEEAILTILLCGVGTVLVVAVIFEDIVDVINERRLG